MQSNVLAILLQHLAQVHTATCIMYKKLIVWELVPVSGREAHHEHNGWIGDIRLWTIHMKYDSILSIASHMYQWQECQWQVPLQM